VGCAISAWVNNTATTALILPLALTAADRVGPRSRTGILLMAAFAPSLGGIATPVGTAPNLIGLRLLTNGAHTTVSFAHWCAILAPLAIVFTILAALGFHLDAAREKPARASRARDAGASNEVDRSRHSGASLDAGPSRDAGAAPESATPAGPWSLAEKILLPLYGLVILLWILPGVLQATSLRDAAWLQQWSARLPETCVPLLGGLALFLLPARRREPGETRRAPRILDAGVLARIDWSTLLLFGGGLSLGGLMFETGLARALGEAIFAAMPVHGTFGIVLAGTLMAVAVSEVTSNTASAGLVIPVVLELARAAGVDPVKPAIAATVACSFGFMLPVSTPPNALVYATGRVRIRDMVRCGIGLDVLGVLLISTWITWVG